MNIKHYWQQVNEVAAQLPADVVWLMSLDHPDKGTTAGTVVEMYRKDAAVRLVEKTHRLATKPEVEEAGFKQEERSKRTVAREQARASKSMNITPEQLAQLVRGQPIEHVLAPKSK